MCSIKNLTKEDLEQFDGELEEYLKARIKFSTAAQRIAKSGAVSPTVVFDDAWLTVEQNCALCKTLNIMEQTQFEVMANMSHEQRAEHIKKFLLAVMTAAQTKL